MERERWEEAYDHILDHIDSAAGFPAGHTDESISKDIGWSGALEALRTALETLVEQGILIQNDEKYSVVAPKPPDVLRYLELREVLEIYFTRRFVRRLDESLRPTFLDDLFKAQVMTEQAVKKLDGPGFWQACRMFHLALVRGAAYPLAGGVIDRLWEFGLRVYSDRYGKQVTQGHMEEIRNEHKAIRDAIGGADESRAVRAVKEHFRAIRRRAGVERRWRLMSHKNGEEFLTFALGSLGTGVVTSIAMAQPVIATGLGAAAVVTFLVKAKWFEA